MVTETSHALAVDAMNANRVAAHNLPTTKH